MRKNKYRFLIQLWRVGVIILINILIIVLFTRTPLTADALSKMGSRGEEVRQIQQILTDQGFYKGGIDGIFGSATKRAVSEFQKKNGLSADGIAGPKTLAALGIVKSSQSTQAAAGSDYELLARVISAESRGEPYAGQVAVGAVILNRVEHPSFPDTVAGVIYQKGAFSSLRDGQFNEPVADSAYKAATDAINGMDPSGGAIYFYNPKTAKSAWIRKRPAILTIGSHLFCA